MWWGRERRVARRTECGREENAVLLDALNVVGRERRVARRTECGGEENAVLLDALNVVGKRTPCC